MKELLEQILKQQQAIISRLNEISPTSSKNLPTSTVSHVQPSNDLDTIITYYLCNLGVAANLKGYYHLRTAIRMVLENPDLANRITNALYPAVAKKYSTTPARTEQAIRYAIKTGWSRASLKFVESIFAYTAIFAKGKPTNSEFISMIANHIRLHYSFK